MGSLRSSLASRISASLIEEFRSELGETPHTWVERSSSQLLQNTPFHPIAEWGRQQFGQDLPAEQRLADLEDTLRLVAWVLTGRAHSRSRSRSRTCSGAIPRRSIVMRALEQRTLVRPSRGLERTGWYFFSSLHDGTKVEDTLRIARRNREERLRHSSFGGNKARFFRI
jgi:hypothetical protein